MLKIDWTGFASTKGNRIQAQILAPNQFKIIPNGPFIVGWDYWSDGSKVEYWWPRP